VEEFHGFLGLILARNVEWDGFNCGFGDSGAEAAFLFGDDGAAACRTSEEGEIEERSFVAKDAPLDDGQVRGVVRVTFAAEPDRKKRG